MGGVEIAHQLGDPCSGLRHPCDRNGALGHLHVSEIHTFRQTARQLIKHDAAARTIALQGLDGLHALQQLLATYFQLIDLLRTPIQLDHGAPDQVITRQLPLHGAVHKMIQHKQTRSRDYQQRHQHAYIPFAALFAQPLTPWQQIDSRHQSNPLKARPQAVNSCAASQKSASGARRGWIFTPANGLSG